MKLNVELVKVNNKLHISVIEMRMLPWIFYHTQQDKIINHITRETVEVARIVERWFA